MIILLKSGVRST